MAVLHTKTNIFYAMQICWYKKIKWSKQKMSNYTKEEIEEFKKGEGTELYFTTVGELKEILSHLPNDFGVRQDISKSASVCIYNLGEPDQHIMFEGGEW